MNVNCVNDVMKCSVDRVAVNSYTYDAPREPVRTGVHSLLHIVYWKMWWPENSNTLYVMRNHPRYSTIVIAGMKYWPFWPYLKMKNNLILLVKAVLPTGEIRQPLFTHYSWAYEGKVTTILSLGLLSTKHYFLGSEWGHRVAGDDPLHYREITDRNQGGERTVTRQRLVRSVGHTVGLMNLEGWRMKVNRLETIEDAVVMLNFNSK